MAIEAFSTDDIAITSVSAAELPRPRVWVKSLTFSDGTVLELDRDEIVLFVGPNNAGKSALLREIFTLLIVVEANRLRFSGKPASITMARWFKSRIGSKAQQFKTGTETIFFPL